MGLTPALLFPLYPYSPSCGGGGWGEPSAGSPLPPNTSHPQRMARTRHPQRSARGLPCLGSSQGSASHAGHRVRSDCSSITTWQRVTLPAFVWTPGSNSTAFQCWEPEALEDPGSLRPPAGSTHCTPTLQSWGKAQVPPDMQTALQAHCHSHLDNEWALWNCGVEEALRVPWTARRSSQSILKEISPGCSLEGLMLKLKLQYSGHLIRRTDSLEKSLMLGKIEGRRRRG